MTGTITLFNHLTLDGVMQAPGRPDEDTRGGFQHGGWAAPRIDAVVGAAGAQGMSNPNGGGLILGRRTYEGFYAVWPKRTDNPFTPALNRSPRYVASRTLREPLPWENSTLLRGDAADAIAELKAQSDRDFTILILGTGQRMFGEDGPPTDLTLVDSNTSTTGVIIATYERSFAA